MNLHKITNKFLLVLTLNHLPNKYQQCHIILAGLFSNVFKKEKNQNFYWMIQNVLLLLLNIMC